MTDAESAELPAKKLVEPSVRPASSEGENAIKSFQLTPGFNASLFAAEPNFANPVAFATDEKGDFYVVETFRHYQGVIDIRGRQGWPNDAFYDSVSEERKAAIRDEMMDVDLASKTVGERVAYLKKYMGDGVSYLEGATERVSKIVDTDGDGVADTSTVFAEGFNDIADGLASGVLVRDGKVWFTNIPHLWLLEDQDGDGVADTRESLHYGYGVHSGFLGHDLHGIVMGPDGRLYFTIGDRGAHVVTDSRTIDYPDAGAVFRCEPDGSNLEIFAYGLRNPQELVFDDHGNLFTGDNNSDGGDQARIVYVVEGGNSGWSIGYQAFNPSPSRVLGTARGAWNAEKLWHPQWDGQAAYIVPPIINLSNGPSGFAYNPGTALTPEFQNRFFLCDFKGSPAVSGVYSFRLDEKGAGFELIEPEQFVWNVLVTDVDFGVDGSLYVLDWVEGWNRTGKGRIYRIAPESFPDQQLVNETRQLIADGMENRSVRQLSRLLSHQDRRVRQEAQFEFAARGPQSVNTLINIADRSRDQLARIHAIWGLGQIGRASGKAKTPERIATIDALIGLLEESDAEIRSQSAKILGELKADEAEPALIALLSDDKPRPRFFAAVSLGKVGSHLALPQLYTMLEQNADQDPYLRHAGVMALSGMRNIPRLISDLNHPSDSVRMAILLAMRRMDMPEILAFLNDDNERIVTEAARAINDAPIVAAQEELAELPLSRVTNDSILTRVLNANFRLGTAEAAGRLAAVAADENQPEAARLEALEFLQQWPNPSGRDHVMGVWRPLVQSSRDAYVPSQALKPQLEGLLASDTPRIVESAARACGALGIAGVDEQLLALVKSDDYPTSARVAALESLAKLGSVLLQEAAGVAAASEQQRLRIAASRYQAEDPSDPTARIVNTLENGSLQEQQNAFAQLGEMEGSGADNLIGQWLDQLLDDKLAPTLLLDLIEAAEKRDSDVVKSKLETYSSRFSEEDSIAEYRGLLAGGDAENGRKLFFERDDLSCLRCHKMGDTGGEAGPDLTGIGSRVDRTYLMESLVFPNRKIAEGFSTEMIATVLGDFYAGRVLSEDDEKVIMLSPEEGRVEIDKSEIESREPGLSGMPDGMIYLATPRGVRDLVEYLANEK